MLPYREMRIEQIELLVVEREPGLYRLYVRTDRERFAHYDSGSFRSLDDASKAARQGFDPGPFLMFPYAPLKRDDVLERAPHGFERDGG